MLPQGSATGSRNIAYGLTVDSSNSIWICGSLGGHAMGSILLDSLVVLLPPIASTDAIFIAQYSQIGELIHYEALPTGGDDNINISADKIGNIYICGDMEGIDPFIIGQDSLHLYNDESEGMFVAKYGSNYLVGIQKLTQPRGQISIFPNPTDKEININSTEVIKSVEIENVLGQILYRNSFNSEKIMVSVNNFPNGIYLIKINGTEVRKFVKE